MQSQFVLALGNSVIKKDSAIVFLHSAICSCTRQQSQFDLYIQHFFSFLGTGIQIQYTTQLSIMRLEQSVLIRQQNLLTRSIATTPSLQGSTENVISIVEDFSVYAYILIVVLYLYFINLEMNRQQQISSFIRVLQVYDIRLKPFTNHVMQKTQGLSI